MLRCKSDEQSSLQKARIQAQENVPDAGYRRSLAPLIALARTTNAPDRQC